MVSGGGCGGKGGREIYDGTGTGISVVLSSISEYSEYSENAEYDAN
jgi:hypothetical protein